MATGRPVNPDYVPGRGTSTRRVPTTEVRPDWESSALPDWVNYTFIPLFMAGEPWPDSKTVEMGQAALILDSIVSSLGGAVEKTGTAISTIDAGYTSPAKPPAFTRIAQQFDDQTGVVSKANLAAQFAERFGYFALEDDYTKRSINIAFWVSVTAAVIGAVAVSAPFSALVIRLAAQMGNVRAHLLMQRLMLVASRMGPVVNNGRKTALASNAAGRYLHWQMATELPEEILEELASEKAQWDQMREGLRDKWDWQKTKAILVGTVVGTVGGVWLGRHVGKIVDDMPGIRALNRMAGDRTGVLAAFQRYPGRMLMTGLPNMFASPLGSVVANKVVYGEWGDFTLQSMVGGFAAGAARTGTISPFNLDVMGAAVRPITTLSNYAASVGSHLTDTGTTTSAATGGGPNGSGPAKTGDRPSTGGPGSPGPDSTSASPQQPAPQPVVPHQRAVSDVSDPAPATRGGTDANQQRTPAGDQQRTPAADQQRAPADQPGIRRQAAPDQPAVAAQADRNGTAPAPDRATPSAAQQSSAPDQRTTGQRNPDQAQAHDPANAQDQREAVPPAQTHATQTHATQTHATQQVQAQPQPTQQSPGQAEAAQNQSQAQATQPQTQPQPQAQAAPQQNAQAQGQATTQTDTVAAPAAHAQTAQNGQAALDAHAAVTAAMPPSATASVAATSEDSATPTGLPSQVAAQPGGRNGADADPTGVNADPAVRPIATGAGRRSDYTLVTARPVRRSRGKRAQAESARAERARRRGSRFVVKRRPAGTPRMTVSEVRAQFLTNAAPSDIAGVRGWTWKADDDTLIVHHTTLGDIHFRVERPGRLMWRRHGLRLFRPLARTKVGAGTAEQPHALRPNRNVASDQLARLVIHEISDSLQVQQARQAGVHTARRLLAPHPGGHDFCLDSRHNEYRNLKRRLAEATTDAERADIQHEIDLLLAELREHGHPLPDDRQDRDAVTTTPESRPDPGAGLAELRSDLEQRNTSVTTASAELRRSLLDRAAALRQAEIDLDGIGLRHYEATIQLSEQVRAALQNGDLDTANALMAAAQQRHRTADAYQAARAAAAAARAAHEAAADLLAARPLVMTDLTRAVEEALKAYAGYRAAVRDAVPFAAPMPDPASGNLRSAVATRVAALTLPAIDLYTAARENSDAADRASEQERAARAAGDTAAAETAHRSEVSLRRVATAYGEAAASLYRARTVYQSLLDRLGVSNAEVAQAFQHAHTLERFALMTVDLTATTPDPAAPLADLRAALEGRTRAVTELRQVLGRYVTALDLAAADMHEASTRWTAESLTAFGRAGDATARQELAEALHWQAAGTELQQAAEAHDEARRLADRARTAYQAAADVLPYSTDEGTLDVGALTDRMRAAEEEHRRYQQAVDALPSPQTPPAAPEQSAGREFGELAERRAAVRERMAMLAQEAERLDQLDVLHQQEGEKAAKEVEKAHREAEKAIGQRDDGAAGRRADAEADAEFQAENARRHFRIARRYQAASGAARDAARAHAALLALLNDATFLGPLPPEVTRAIADAEKAYDDYLRAEEAALPPRSALVASLPVSGRLANQESLAEVINRVADAGYSPEGAAQLVRRDFGDIMSGDGAVIKLDNGREILVRGHLVRMVESPGGTNANELMIGHFAEDGASVSLTARDSEDVTVKLDAATAAKHLPSERAQVAAEIVVAEGSYGRGTNSSRRSTAGNFAQRGSVLDNRGPSTRYQAVLVLEVSRRTATGAWAPPTRVAGDELQGLWVPAPLTEPAPDNLVQMDPGEPLKGPMPGHIAIGSTGLNGTADDMVAHLVDSGYGQAAQDQLRTLMTGQLPVHWSEATSAAGFVRHFSDGQREATLRVHGKMVLVKVVGGRSNKLHLEQDLPIGFSSAWQGSSAGRSGHFSVTGGVKIPLWNWVARLTGGYSRARSHSESTNVGGTGVMPGVPRWAGDLHVYEMVAMYWAVLELQEAPRKSFAGESRALFLFPLPHAANYNLPVDAAAVVGRRPDGTFITRDDPSPEAPPGRKLELPDHMKTGKVRGARHSRIDDIEDVDEVFPRTIKHLRAVGLLPRMVNGAPLYDSDPRAEASQRRNETIVAEQLTLHELKEGYSRAAQHGYPIRLSMQRTGRATEYFHLRVHANPDMDDVTPVGPSRAKPKVGLPIGSDGTSRTESTGRSWDGSAGPGVAALEDDGVDTAGGGAGFKRSSGSNLSVKEGVQINEVGLDEAPTTGFKVGTDVWTTLEGEYITGQKGHALVDVPTALLPYADDRPAGPAHQTSVEALKRGRTIALDMGDIAGIVASQLGLPREAVALNQVDELFSEPGLMAHPEVFFSELRVEVIVDLPGHGTVRVPVRLKLEARQSQVFAAGPWVGGNILMSMLVSGTSFSTSTTHSVDGSTGLQLPGTPSVEGGLSGSRTVSRGRDETVILASESLDIDTGLQYLSETHVVARVSIGASSLGTAQELELGGTAIRRNAERDALELYSRGEMPLSLHQAADAAERLLNGSLQLNRRVAIRFVRRYLKDLKQARSELGIRERLTTPIGVPHVPLTAEHTKRRFAERIEELFYNESTGEVTPPDEQPGGSSKAKPHRKLRGMLAHALQLERQAKRVAVPDGYDTAVGMTLLGRTRLYYPGRPEQEVELLEGVTAALEMIAPGVVADDVSLYRQLFVRYAGNRGKGGMDDMLAPDPPPAIVGEGAQQFAVTIRARFGEADDRQEVYDKGQIEQDYLYGELSESEAVGWSAGGNVKGADDGSLSLSTDREHSSTAVWNDQTTDITGAARFKGAEPDVMHHLRFDIEVQQIVDGKPTGPVATVTLQGTMERILLSGLATREENAPSRTPALPDPRPVSLPALPGGMHVEWARADGLAAAVIARAQQKDVLNRELTFAEQAKLRKLLGRVAVKASLGAMATSRGHRVDTIQLDPNRPDQVVDVWVQATVTDPDAVVGDLDGTEIRTVNRRRRKWEVSATRGHLVPVGVTLSEDHKESGAGVNVALHQQSVDNVSVSGGRRTENSVFEQDVASLVDVRTDFSVRLVVRNLAQDEVVRTIEMPYAATGTARIELFTQSLADNRAEAEQEQEHTTRPAAAPATAPMSLQRLLDEAARRDGFDPARPYVAAAQVLDAGRPVHLVADADPARPYGQIQLARLLARQIGADVAIDVTAPDGTTHTYVAEPGGALWGGTFAARFAALPPELVVVADQHGLDLHALHRRTADRDGTLADHVRAELRRRGIPELTPPAPVWPVKSIPDAGDESVHSVQPVTVTARPVRGSRGRRTGFAVKRRPAGKPAKLSPAPGTTAFAPEGPIDPLTGTRVRGAAGQAGFAGLPGWGVNFHHDPNQPNAHGWGAGDAASQRGRQVDATMARGREIADQHGWPGLSPRRTRQLGEVAEIYHTTGTAVGGEGHRARLAWEKAQHELGGERGVYGTALRAVRQGDPWVVEALDGGNPDALTTALVDYAEDTRLLLRAGQRLAARAGMHGLTDQELRALGRLRVGFGSGLAAEPAMDQLVRDRGLRATLEAYLDLERMGAYTALDLVHGSADRLRQFMDLTGDERRRWAGEAVSRLALYPSETWADLGRLAEVGGPQLFGGRLAPEGNTPLKELVAARGLQPLVTLHLAAVRDGFRPVVDATTPDQLADALEQAASLQEATDTARPEEAAGERVAQDEPSPRTRTATRYDIETLLTGGYRVTGWLERELSLAHALIEPLLWEAHERGQLVWEPEPGRPERFTKEVARDLLKGVIAQDPDRWLGAALALGLGLHGLEPGQARALAWVQRAYGAEIQAMEDLAQHLFNLADEAGLSFPPSVGRQVLDAIVQGHERGLIPARPPRDALESGLRLVATSGQSTVSEPALSEAGLAAVDGRFTSTGPMTRQDVHEWLPVTEYDKLRRELQDLQAANPELIRRYAPGFDTRPEGAVMLRAFTTGHDTVINDAVRQADHPGQSPLAGSVAEMWAAWRDLPPLAAPASYWLDLTPQELAERIAETEVVLSEFTVVTAEADPPATGVPEGKVRVRFDFDVAGARELGPITRQAGTRQVLAAPGTRLRVTYIAEERRVVLSDGPGAPPAGLTPAVPPRALTFRKAGLPATPGHALSVSASDWFTGDDTWMEKGGWLASRETYGDRLRIYRRLSTRKVFDMHVVGDVLHVLQNDGWHRVEQAGRLRRVDPAELTPEMADRAARPPSARYGYAGSLAGFGLRIHQGPGMTSTRHEGADVIVALSAGHLVGLYVPVRGDDLAKLTTPADALHTLTHPETGQPGIRLRNSWMEFTVLEDGSVVDAVVLPVDVTPQLVGLESVEAVTEPSGFAIGAVNENQTIARLQEFGGVPRAEVQERLRQAGLLGRTEDVRDALVRDNTWVLGAELTHHDVAQPLRLAARVLRHADQAQIMLGGHAYHLRVVRRSDLAVSPLGRATPDVTIEVVNVATGERLAFDTVISETAASHGFYGGRRSPARVSPEQIVLVFTHLNERLPEARLQALTGYADRDLERPAGEVAVHAVHTPPGTRAPELPALPEAVAAPPAGLRPLAGRFAGNDTMVVESGDSGMRYYARLGSGDAIARIGVQRVSSDETRIIVEYEHARREQERWTVGRRGTASLAKSDTRHKLDWATEKQLRGLGFTTVAEDGKQRIMRFTHGPTTVVAVLDGKRRLTGLYSTVPFTPAQQRLVDAATILPDTSHGNLTLDVNGLSFELRLKRKHYSTPGAPFATELVNLGGSSGRGWAFVELPPASPEGTRHAAPDEAAEIAQSLRQVTASPAHLTGFAQLGATPFWRGGPFVILQRADSGVVLYRQVTDATAQPENVREVHDDGAGLRIRASGATLAITADGQAETLYRIATPRVAHLLGGSTEGVRMGDTWLEWTIHPDEPHIRHLVVPAAPATIHTALDAASTGRLDDVRAVEKKFAQQVTDGWQGDVPGVLRHDGHLVQIEGTTHTELAMPLRLIRALDDQLPGFDRITIGGQEYEVRREMPRFQVRSPFGDLLDYSPDYVVVHKASRKELRFPGRAGELIAAHGFYGDNIHMPRVDPQDIKVMFSPVLSSDPGISGLLPGTTTDAAPRHPGGGGRLGASPYWRGVSRLVKRSATGDPVLYLKRELLLTYDARIVDVDATAENGPALLAGFRTDDIHAFPMGDVRMPSERVRSPRRYQYGRWEQPLRQQLQESGFHTIHDDGELRILQYTWSGGEMLAVFVGEELDGFFSRAQDDETAQDGAANQAIDRAAEADGSPRTAAVADTGAAGRRPLRGTTAFAPESPIDPLTGTPVRGGARQAGFAGLPDWGVNFHHDPNQPNAHGWPDNGDPADRNARQQGPPDQEGTSNRIDQLINRPAQPSHEAQGSAGDLDRPGQERPEPRSRQSRPVTQPWHAQAGFREPTRIGHWTFPGELVLGLMSGVKESVRLSGGLMNEGHVWKLTFHDGTTAVLKDLTEPRTVDAEAWFARRRTDSEELASLAFEAIGARVPRVYRMGPTRLLMEHLDGFTMTNALNNPRDVLLIGLGDALVLNTDRWGANFMATRDRRVAGIDHEFCFAEPHDRLVPRGASMWALPFIERTRIDFGGDMPSFVYEWTDGNPLASADVARITSRLRDLEQNFAARGRLDWHAAMMERWEGIAAHAVGGPGSIIDPPAGHFGRSGSAANAPDEGSRQPAGDPVASPEEVAAPPAQGPARPVPELTARHRELILNFRHEVAAGIWYRDPAVPVLPMADPRLLRPTPDIIDVGIVADGTHFLIGNRRLTTPDLATMLAHDPRVLAGPDAALRVLGCEFAQNRTLLQELADLTGREVIAGDRMIYISADRQVHTASVQGYTGDGRPIFPASDDGAWHRAVPSSRVASPERPAQVRASWPEPERGLTSVSIAAAAAAAESSWTALHHGEDGMVDLTTLDDGTSVIRKIMWMGESRPLHAEILAALVGEQLGANIAHARPHPTRGDAILMQHLPGRVTLATDLRSKRGAVLIELLDILVVNHDRPGNLLLHGDDLFAIDHGRAFMIEFLDLAEHGESLSGNFLGHGPDDRFGWVDNPLTRQDVDLLTERLHRLRPEFERYGMLPEYDVMMDRLYHVGLHAKGTVPLIAQASDQTGTAQHHFGPGTPVTGTVYRELDLPVRRIRPGSESSALDTVLSMHEYFPFHAAPMEVVTYSRTGTDLGDGRVSHAPGTRFKILGVHHGAYTTPNGMGGARLYTVELPPEPLPVRQAPPLEPRHQELIRQFRHEVAAGVWYRDADTAVMPTADLRLLRPTPGILDVGIAGDLIGSHRLTPQDLGIMLVHDPRLIADPDAALRVLSGGTGANPALLQVLADTTGREIIGSDGHVFIGAHLQAHAAMSQRYTEDGRPVFPGRGDSAWRIAVPEAGVAPPTVAAEVSAPEHGPAPVPEALRSLFGAKNVAFEELGHGDDGVVDLIRVDGRPRGVRKEMHLSAPRGAPLEVVVSQAGKAIGANVPHAVLDPDDSRAVIMEYVDGSALPDDGSVLRSYRGRRDAILIGLLDVLTGNVDRHFENLLRTDDDRLYGIDHARAFGNDRLHVHRLQPFVSAFVGRLSDGSFGWLPANPLTRQDVELITERLHALHPEFERYDLHEEFAFVMERLYHVGLHAKGGESLIAAESGPVDGIDHHFGARSGVQ